MFNSLLFLFGIWQGTLSLPDAVLPFNFELKEEKGKNVFIIHNADERIVCDEITVKGDSLFIKIPVFDSEFRVKATPEKMSGKWINYGRKGNPEIVFNAKKNIKERFIVSSPPKYNITGKWETWFDSGDPDSSVAIGVFNQVNEKVSGTFLTETGDHRYLEGVVDGDSLKLSVFDGSHCWLYKAQLSNNAMKGVQWSGTTYKGNFRSVKNEKIELRKPDNISRIDGTLDFKFPDLDSNIVSLSDDRFKGKVVIVQIMGSWCPNCMDETAFLSEYYKAHHAEGLEMIGLAFERFPEFEKASANVKRFTTRLKVDYPVLIAGISGKENVMKQLPALKDFISFPTSIFIDRNGKVVKVHAGFSGPATGAAYDDFVKEFDQFVQRMLR